MSLGKKILFTILVFFVLITLGINIWYLSILIFGDKKIVSQTYEIGVQTLVGSENPEDTKYFIEVNSMADMFEIKFNYMLDENQDKFFSQGLQFMADSDGNINFGYEETEVDQIVSDNDYRFLQRIEHSKRYVDGYLTSDHYNYMSGNDYEDCLISTNPIGNDSFFKIQLGEPGNTKLYGMKFKGHAGFNEQYGYYTYDVPVRWYPWEVSLYYSYDFIYFAEKLYKSIQSLDNGTSHALIFEFADMFDYYEYDEEKGVYSKDPVVLDKVNTIQKEVKSYYSILVHKSENKVEKSSDSIFNCVRGISGFNETEDIVSEDYFVGRTIVDVTINHFDLVNIVGNSYALKLSNKFISNYRDIADLILLDVVIDLDYFNLNAIEFVGFTADSGLTEFKVLQCRTSETIDGNVVYSGVSYV